MKKQRGLLKYVYTHEVGWSHHFNKSPVCNLLLAFKVQSIFVKGIIFDRMGAKNDLKSRQARTILRSCVG